MDCKDPRTDKKGYFLILRGGVLLSTSVWQKIWDLGFEEGVTASAGFIDPCLQDGHSVDA